MRSLFVIGAILFALGIAGAMTTIVGIIHSFNDIAVKGNASPAVVAVGLTNVLIPLSLGLLLMLIAVLVIARGVYLRRLRTAKKPNAP